MIASVNTFSQLEKQDIVLAFIFSSPHFSSDQALLYILHKWILKSEDFCPLFCLHALVSSFLKWIHNQLERFIVKIKYLT